jgi:predicted N-acyltransferase
MPDGREAIAVRILKNVSEVPAAAWDACAGPDNPFVSHAFLSALERSGSASAETGWLPQHLAIADPSGDLSAVLPLYLKNHSYGEYVFDWGWADAYERAGGSYYPKLQCSVPFTPVAGPRLLIRPGGDREALANALIAAMVQLVEEHGASSVHVTFTTREEYERLGAAGFLQRLGVQYHWENRGYGDFEDFLAGLASRKRKQIRRERRQVAESGIRLRVLQGAEIEPHHWRAFYRFYLATVDKKWAHAYLTRDFFDRLGASMADQVALVLAEDGDEPVAAALNLIGGDTLYGRNWGCAKRYRFLHFEACYYQAIEFAIAQGLTRVEAGAQGEHKIQRGYLPSETYSAHWIADPALRDAVAHFLERERPAMRYQQAALSQQGPFRR